MLADAEKEFAKLIRQYNEAHPLPKPMDQLSPVEIRSAGEYLEPYFTKPAKVSFEDRDASTIDGRNTRIRIFRAPEKFNGEALIFAAGNAWINKIFEANSAIVSKLAEKSNARMILVDTSTLPENPFPAALNDMRAAITYTFKHAKEWKINKEKVAVGGWSSGANLAAVTVNELRSHPQIKICHQLLVSGVFNLHNPDDRFVKYEHEDPLLTQPFARRMAKLYAPTENDRKDPKRSPFFDPDFKELPPTTMIVSEYDGLRGQTESYAEKLEEAGNEVTRVVLKGTTHNSILLREGIKGEEDPFQTIIKYINEIC